MFIKIVLNKRGKFSKPICCVTKETNFCQCSMLHVHHNWDTVQRLSKYSVCIKCIKNKLEKLLKLACISDVPSGCLLKFRLAPMKGSKRQLSNPFAVANSHYQLS